LPYARFSSDAVALHYVWLMLPYIRIFCDAVALNYIWQMLPSIRIFRDAVALKFVWQMLPPFLLSFVFLNFQATDPIQFIFFGVQEPMQH
jgi:hypothetical protein